MHYWLIADTHFAPADRAHLSDHSANRQNRLWAALRRIPAGDMLIHLGDVCVTGDEEIHTQLAREVLCKRVLIRGNHDLKSTRWYLAHSWSFVCDGLHLTYKKYRLLLTHRPFFPDPQHFCRNIHGHTHGRLQRGHLFGEEMEEPATLETVLKTVQSGFVAVAEDNR
jgi:calcineurin-like phosphoesterase family protein